MGVCNIHKPLVGLRKDQPTNFCHVYVLPFMRFICLPPYIFEVKEGPGVALKKVDRKRVGIIASLEVTRARKNETEQKLDRQYHDNLSNSRLLKAKVAIAI